MSKRDYFQDISDLKKLILNYVLFDKYGDIDYTNVFYLCKNNHDIACRYGVDSIVAEIALIIRKDDMKNYMSNEIISRLKKKGLPRNSGANEKTIKIRV